MISNLKPDICHCKKGGVGVIFGSSYDGCKFNLFQNETSVISNKEIFEILNHRGTSDKIGTGYRACILKTSLIG